MEASHTPPLLIICLCLSASLFFAASPVESKVNLTGILAKTGQHSILLHLLNITQTGTQLTNELNSAYQGLTIFAPTDAAFKSLPSGFLNSLSEGQQVKLILYHVLSQFYTWDDFRTVSNPVISEATGTDGPYGLNFTFVDDQKVNVSLGDSEITFTKALTQKKPLAMYQLDKVLVPEDKFSDNPAPSPESAKNEAATPKVPTPKKSSSSSAGSSRIHGQHRNLKGGLLAVLGLACIGLLSM